MHWIYDKPLSIDQKEKVDNDISCKLQDMWKTAVKQWLLEQFFYLVDALAFFVSIGS